MAWLHVTLEFLKDVREHLFDIILSVEEQTNDFTVPFNDIFLPTEGDFARLRALMGSCSWMFPEAFEWPRVLRDEMHRQPVSQLVAFTQDFERAAEMFTYRLTEFRSVEEALSRWIARVQDEQEARDMSDALS